MHYLATIENCVLKCILDNKNKHNVVHTRTFLAIQLHDLVVPPVVIVFLMLLFVLTVSGITS